MKRYLLLFIVLYSALVVGAKDIKNITIYDVIWPEKLEKLNPLKSYTQKQLIKEFGNPTAIVDGVHYYEFNGYKYPLALTYKKEKLVSIHFRFLKKHSFMTDLKKLGFSYKMDIMPSSDTFYKVYLTDQKLTLTYRKTDDSLYSLEQDFR